MTTHFAAARKPGHRAFAFAFAPPAPGEAANDNGLEPLNAALLRAALKHFARYGLGAAENARAEAERAFFADDREGYRWWLEICRALDRRMASSLRSRTEQAPDRQGV